MLRAAFCVAFALTVYLSFSTDTASSQGNAANITYVSGTCKKTTPDFNMSTFYNQESMLVSSFDGIDISGSDWDLGRDGAFVGYNVFFCAPGNQPPEGFFTLIEQKGFSITRSCNTAGLLTYPAYHVFIIFDYVGDRTVLSTADAIAIRNFYMIGGGIYALTDNCPHFRNANVMYNSMPHPINKFYMRFNNAITPYPLRNGNPVGNNQFGHHPTFTGIPELSAGHSLSIPYYDGQLGIGVFAPMATIVISKVPSRCDFEGSAPYVFSHATIMYVDPPVQLVNYSESCNWGRIIHDTGFTRYYVDPMRTGSHRLAANVVVWLLNIERVLERKASGTPLNSTDTSNCAKAFNTSVANSSSTEVDVNKTQVLGCSNGDAVTLKSPAMMCRVGFAGGADAPACLALIVTEGQGTTCVVDIQNAKIGTYWIMVDGKNSSLQFSVTAASLTPRGTITAVSGTCVKLSDTAVSGCTDGSSITIDWTLPYPRELTLGLGSSVSVCSTFAVSGTNVYCVLRGLNKLAKGRYQSYINGVSTGIPLTIQTDIASLNRALCSGSHTISPQASSEVTSTLTIFPTKSPSSTVTLVETFTTSHAFSASTSMSVSATQSGSLTLDRSATVTTTGTLLISPSTILSRSHSVFVTATVDRILSSTLSPSRAVTNTTNLNITTTVALTISTSISSTANVSRTHTGALTLSHSWGCVDGTSLATVLQPYAGGTGGAFLVERVQDSDIRNGTVLVLNNFPTLPSNAKAPALHVPWFERWEVRAQVEVVSCPNQNGFADPVTRAVPVIIIFPDGMQAAETSSTSPATTTRAIVVIPPIPGYRIYSQESVLLNVHLGDLTLGSLCGDGGDKGGNGTSRSVTMMTLLVDVNVDELLASAQAVVTPVIAVMTAAVPFAAPDLQAMVAIALMPCSNSYQKRTFAMFRALSVFTLDDSFEGVLWGNLIANVAGLGLHMAVIGVVSVVKHLPVAEAAVTARFPGLYLLLVWQLTFASNVFAAVQLLADSGTTDANKGLAGGILFVFCVAIPGSVIAYVSLRVEAAYYVYEYHKWRRADTKLRVRLLSRVLLPVGRWEPREVRRRIGSFVTLQSRPERCWMVLPLVSPSLVALFSLVRYQSDATCVYVFIVLALLHAVLIGLVIFFKPLRSMIEDWFAAAGFSLTTLYLCFTAVNLAYPRLKSLETAVAVAVMCQTALLFVRMCYHVSHIFIARRLADVVPRVLLFEWFRGKVRFEDDVDLERCRNLADKEEHTVSSKLFEELNAALMGTDDDDVELFELPSEGNDYKGDFVIPTIGQDESVNIGEGEDDSPNNDILRNESGGGHHARKKPLRHGEEKISNDEFMSLLDTMEADEQ